MLDDRLLGDRFTLTSPKRQGVVVLYGVYYHYHIEGPYQIGDTVEIITVTPRQLVVKVVTPELDF